MPSMRARTNASAHLRVPELTAPEWLLALARPKPAAVPSPAMVRAMVGRAARDRRRGRLPVGLFIAMGALAGLTGDRRGPYRVRALQISGSAVAGACGFAIGGAAFGHGTLVLAVLVLVA